MPAHLEYVWLCQQRSQCCSPRIHLGLGPAGMRLPAKHTKSFLDVSYYSLLAPMLFDSCSPIGVIQNQTQKHLWRLAGLSWHTSLKSCSVVFR